MQEFNRHINSTILHFNKWRNTSYAIFHSIGREVVIGVVSCILEKLVTVKASVASYLFGFIVEKILDEEESNENLAQAIEDGLLEEILNSVLLNKKFQGFIPASRKRNNIYYQFSNKACFGPFLFPAFCMGSKAFFQFSLNNHKK